MSPRLAPLAIAATCLAGSTHIEAGSNADLHGTARSGARAEATAVIWLEAPLAPPASPNQPIVISQQNMAFAPRVTAIRVGTTVEFPNDDRVFHNVFSFHDGKRFDLGTYPVGASRRVVFSQAGVSRLFCNIHPNMAGYVVAVDSPYFATTAPDGSFTIGGVPPGQYTYRAWRPSGTLASGSVELPSTQPLKVVWP